MTQSPLSNVETEQVRDLRARLNRMPTGGLGDKSVGPLSKGFFDVCARVGLTARPVQPGLDLPAPGVVLEASRAADMSALQTLVTTLYAIKAADPSHWRKSMDQGALQAILTRRLVLAGREPAGVT